MSNKCLDELVVSMFLDNELAPGQRKKVELHLETCTRCRESVRKQETENTQIKEVLKITPVPDLVPAVMEKLDSPAFSCGSQPDQRHQRSKFINRLNYRWVLATAASLLLVLFLSLFLMTPDKSETNETRVILCSAEVEGVEVQTHIYESEKPDIQFIWLEKKNE